MNRPLALIRLRYLLAVRQFSGGAKWSNRLVGALLMGLGAAVSSDSLRAQRLEKYAGHLPLSVGDQLTVSVAGDEDLASEALNR